MVSPVFSAFSVACCAARLATGLKLARPIKFSKSSPGVKRIRTPVMFFSVNASQFSAPSLLSDSQKLPRSSSKIFLPSSNCSTRQLHMSASTPFTWPRLWPPCSAMCATNWRKPITSFTCALA